MPPLDKTDFYKRELEPVIHDLKAMRQRLVRMLFTVGGSVLLLGFGVFLFVPENAVSAVVMLTLILVALIYNYFASTFYSNFKQQVIRKIISYINPDLSYAGHRCIQQDDFIKSRLFLSKFNRYQGFDYIYGQLDGLDIELSELDVENTLKDEGTDTIFKGFFFIIKFAKRSPAVTLVYPARRRPPRFLGGYERTKLEDIIFEGRFDVYTNDQVEARVQLTTTFMERIMDLRAVADRTPRLSFIDDKLYIAVPSNRDNFDVSFFDSLHHSTFVNDTAKELDLLLKLPRVLQLDDNARGYSSTSST